MNKIFQTDTSDTTGNCLQACIASVLGLPLESVPHLAGIKDWHDRYFQYFYGKGKVIMTIVPPSINALEIICRQLNFEGVCIFAVESFHHLGKLHAVVGRINGGCVEVIHDPNPLNKDRRIDEYGIVQIDLILEKI